MSPLYFRHRPGHIGSHLVVITGRAGNYRDYFFQIYRQGKNLTRCLIGFRLGRNPFVTYTRLFVRFQAGQDFFMKHFVAFTGGDTHD